MTNYQLSDVYNYISCLETYLKGDLEQFHKICRDVEKQEHDDTLLNAATPITSSFTTSTSATTTETTQSPHGNTGCISTPKYFRTTIPHTLTLFSTIDFIGYLSGTNDSIGSTMLNFREFFKHSPILVSKDEDELLSQVYRNGMGHVYFPKLDLGISYHSTNPTGKLFFRNSNGLIVLNVNQLEEIVIKTLDKIKVNSALYNDMERKYQSTLSSYQNQHSRLINRINI